MFLVTDILPVEAVNSYIDEYSEMAAVNQTTPQNLMMIFHPRW